MAEKISPNKITQIVDEVVKQLQQSGISPIINSPQHSIQQENKSSKTPAFSSIDQSKEGIFSNIQDAINTAEISQKQLMTLTLIHRKAIIQAMRDAVIASADNLAKIAHEETGLGRYEHKIQKNLLAAKKTPGVEDIQPVSYTGDDGLTLVEQGPYGVIGAITPITNPTSTAINNSISMISAGNSIVFNHHPGAKKCTNETIRILNRGIVSAGGPPNLICSTENPTLKSSKTLMDHRQVKLLCVTGGGAVVKVAMSSGKKCIAAGPGNPPVIVDDTANIQKAAKDIIAGASFDNNILCTAEKEVFVFNNVADYLVEEMKRSGAFEITESQIDDVVKVCFEHKNGRYHINRKWVGKDANLILNAAGIQINRSHHLNLIIAQVDENHPFIQREMMMPVLGIVRVKDIDEALTMAKKAEKYNRHTAMMHSESVSNLSLVGREIETTIFVKNGPSYAGLGLGGEGFCTLTIAGPTGEGLTSARVFTRQRRCVLVGGFRII